MKILVGCEESQVVAKAFRDLGHEAYSCDLAECSGGHPGWHLMMDVFEAISLGGWDMGIFFPPCTYLTVSAERWYVDQPPLASGALVGEARRVAREAAIDFFMNLYNCDIPRVALENPVGVVSTRFRKPDQVFHPYMFGDDASKKTCLWLRGLPRLRTLPAPEWHPPAYYHGGAPRWSNQAPGGSDRRSPSPDRSKLRSRTYPGVARAMAAQWSDLRPHHDLFGREIFY